MANLISTFLAGTTIAGASLLYCFLMSFLRMRKRLPPLPPGPKGWPVLGNFPNLGRKPDEAVAALVLKYGPMVSLRLGSVQGVIVSSGAAVAGFLKGHDVNFSSRPFSTFAQLVCYNQQDMGTAPYGPFWIDMRKICMSKLSGRAIDETHLSREKETAQLVHALILGGNKAIELRQNLREWSTNVFSMILIGRRLFCGDDQRDGAELTKLLEEIKVMMNAFNVGDFFPWLSWVDILAHCRMKSLAQRFDKFMDRIITKHKRNLGNADRHGPKEDMLTMTLNMIGQPFGEDGRFFSENDIKALFLDLFIGGLDTTATFVECGLAELIRQPETLKSVQEEIDTVVGRGRLVLEKDLPCLPLVQAVVKEVLRVNTGGPLAVQRVAAENCEIGGYHIPKGTVIFLNLRAICEDPAVWPRPLEFWPERFLAGGDNAGAEFRGSGLQFIPFSAGRRICPGINLGLRTLPLLIATLAHAFDWKLPQGVEPKDISLEKIGVVSPELANPLIARPVPRLEKSAYTDKTLL
ncbi:flavonoid 3'-monooxygenase-like [Wolffia australiana]